MTRTIIGTLKTITLFYQDKGEPKIKNEAEVRVKEILDSIIFMAVVELGVKRKW